MGFVLYHSPYSTCSQKVRIALAEKGLAYESREINFGREEHLTPEYLMLNPNGVVPTLVHDGEPVTDSSCILEYLEEVAPAPPLSPSTALGRARMRAWLRYFEEVATAAVRVPSFQEVFLPLMCKFGSAEMFDAGAARRPIRKGFYHKMNSGRGFSNEELENSREQLRQTIERIDGALENSPFLLGDQFTLAECCVARSPTGLTTSACPICGLTSRATLPGLRESARGRHFARPSFPVHACRSAASSRAFCRGSRRSPLPTVATRRQSEIAPLSVSRENIHDRIQGSVLMGRPRNSTTRLLNVSARVRAESLRRICKSPDMPHCQNSVETGQGATIALRKVRSAFVQTIPLGGEKWKARRKSAKRQARYPQHHVVQEQPENALAPQLVRL